MRTNLAMAVLAVAIPASTLLADPPAASQPAPTTKAASVSSYISDIRQATDATSAASAYAKACAIDRNIPELHDAYMRRMIELGRPENANYAAQTLTVIQPTNSLAWGVVGYFNARNNKIMDAFVATMRGIESVKADAGLQANAGQLMAWFESSLSPLKVPQATKETAEASLKDLLEKPAFAAAYKKLKDACDREKQRRDDLNTKLAAASTDLGRTRNDGRAADQAVRNAESAVRDRQAIVNSAQAAVNDKDTPSRRRTLQQAQRDLDQARADLNAAKADLTKAQGAFNAQKAVVDGLQRQLNQKFDPGFKWQPPAQAGQTTATRPAAD